MSSTQILVFFFITYTACLFNFNKLVDKLQNPPILYMIQNNCNALPTMNMSMIFDSHYFLSLITINNLFYSWLPLLCSYKPMLSHNNLKTIKLHCNGLTLPQLNKISQNQKLGFIKRVDKGWITTVKDLESWRFKR